MVQYEIIRFKIGLIYLIINDISYKTMCVYELILQLSVLLLLSNFSSEFSGHGRLPKVLVANAEIHRSKKGKAKEAKLVLCSIGGIRTGRS